MKNFNLTIVMIFIVSASIYAQGPTITSFSPAKGPVGVSVTISGSNFNTTKANNLVYFGATRATISAASASSITVTIPVGATYSPISVQDAVTGLKANSVRSFTPTSIPEKDNFVKSDYMPKVDFAVPGNPHDMQIKDMDGDGNADLVLMHPNGFAVMRNTAVNGSITSNSFAAAVDFWTSLFPTNMTLEDWDGDGKTDVIVNKLEGDLLAFRNTSTPGSITFDAAVTFQTTWVDAFTSGDLNSDGKPDLVTYNENSTISIMLNTSVKGVISNTSFQRKSSAVPFAAYFEGSIINLSDINADGKKDIVLVDGAGKVHVLTNTSTGNSLADISFGDEAVVATAQSLRGLKVADMDNDGRPDIIGSSADAVLLYRNIYTGGNVTAASFSAGIPIAFKTYSNIFDVEVGDINGDGKLDLATSHIASEHFMPNYTSIILNDVINGGQMSMPQTLVNQIDFRTNNQSWSVAIGDIDGDGKPELITGHNFSYNISVYRNNPRYVPYIRSFSPASGPVGASVTIKGNYFDALPANNTIYFGDVKATVTAASAKELTVTVPAGASFKPVTVLNNTTHLSADSKVAFKTTFSASTVNIRPKVDFTTGAKPYAVVTADIDGDGKTDMIVANSASNTISVYRNTATAGSINSSSFAVRVNFATGSQPVALAVCDVNADGKLDVLVANHGSNTFSVFRNTSSPGAITSASFAAKVDFATEVKPFVIQTGDIDSDGYPDVATGHVNADLISIFKNVSTGGAINSTSFRPKYSRSYYPAAQTTGLTLADINGDFNTDMVQLDDNNNAATIQGNGLAGDFSVANFSSLLSYNTGANPRGVIIGDVNGDGKPDLLTANRGGASISVLENNCSYIGDFIRFKPRVDLSSGFGPTTLALGDISGDGKPEIITANTDLNQITGFINNSGSGEIRISDFSNKTSYTTGTHPVSISIADIDGDGKNDIIVANEGSNTVSVIRNGSQDDAFAVPMFTDAEVSVLNDADVNVMVYPNPTTSDIGFALDGYTGNKIRVTLTTLNGRTVNVQEFSVQAKNSFFKLNLPQKPQAGIYMLSIDGKGLNTSKKVIVQ